MHSITVLIYPQTMTNTSKLNHTFPVSTFLKPHDAIPSETDIIVLGTFTEPVTVICYMLMLLNMPIVLVITC